MAYETIELLRNEPVATIKLNRPQRMNAVIEEMYLELQDALATIAASPELRAVILTGSELQRDGRTKQAFCAGADLKKHSSGERTPAQKRAYILLAHETVRQLFQLPKPVIAAVNGPARGAGAEMAVACDLLIMAKDATIAFPEVGLGTFVGGGVTAILPALVGLARAKEIVYSGRVLDGPAAVELGLASRSVPLAELPGEAEALALSLASNAPISMRFAKRFLQREVVHDLDSVLHLEAEAILTCMDSDDWHEGVRAFAERREPLFRGR